MNLQIRPQQVGDAKRFYEILTHPHFVFFEASPKSIEDEKRFLRRNKQRWQNNFAYDYSILLDGNVVGAVGVKIDQHRSHIGEVGYFVNRHHWGKGVAPAAVRLVEPIAWQKLKLARLELVTLTQNAASIRVAEKCGYQLEGIQRAKIKYQGEWADAYLFAKISQNNGDLT